jgi:3-hydroxybutyryl-CoA dehydratase
MRSMATGAQFQEQVTVTGEIISRFADASGDHNPLHVDAEYARKTLFGRRIAHGAWLIARFSRILASELPGPGTIYLSQETTFRSPAYIDDRITFAVKVVEIDAGRKRVKLETTATNQDGVVVASGFALTKISDLSPEEG